MAIMMQLFTFLAVTLITASAVMALPPQYSSGHGPAPVDSAPGPLHSISHQPWQRHIEVREAMPEPAAEANPEAMPEAIAEAIPEAAPHAVPDVDFIPSLVQRSPASEPDPVPGPVESVSHQPWKRAHPAAINMKRDFTELVDMQDHQNVARNASPDILEARQPTPASPKGYPVGPVESVSHQPWKRHVERDAMPEAQPMDVLVV